MTVASCLYVYCESARYTKGYFDIASLRLGDERKYVHDSCHGRKQHDNAPFLFLLPVERIRRIVVAIEAYDVLVLFLDVVV